MAGEDVVRLGVADVLVDAYAAERRDDDFRVHVAFAVELCWRQELDDRDRADAFLGLSGCWFNECHDKLSFSRIDALPQRGKFVTMDIQFIVSR